jgi:hypothetical protein
LMGVSWMDMGSMNPSLARSLLLYSVMLMFSHQFSVVTVCIINSLSSKTLTTWSLSSTSLHGK